MKINKYSLSFLIGLHANPDGEFLQRHHVISDGRTELAKLGLITITEAPSSYMTHKVRYAITDKGRAYVDKVLSVPVPIARTTTTWVFEEETAEARTQRFRKIAEKLEQPTVPYKYTGMSDTPSVCKVADGGPAIAYTRRQLERAREELITALKAVRLLVGLTGRAEPERMAETFKAAGESLRCAHDLLR